MPQGRVFKIRPAPVVVARSLDIPRPSLWLAWSSAENLRRWFAPEGFTVSLAEVDFRVGGAFSIRLQAPGGYELASRGEYVDIAEPSQLAFRSRDGKFSSETTVTFADSDAGTLLTIRQDYEVYAPGYLAVVAGAADAWQTTLDKLEAEIPRMFETAPA